MLNRVHGMWYKCDAFFSMHTICWHRSLQWRHNERDGISNHQSHGHLLNRLFRRRSKKTSKLRVTGLFAGNSPMTCEFPAQRASNAEHVSIWWRHQGYMFWVIESLILCKNLWRVLSSSARCIQYTFSWPSMTLEQEQSPGLYCMIDECLYIQYRAGRCENS